MRYNENKKGGGKMRVVELVRNYIDTKTFWKLPLDSQRQVLQALFKDICDLYGINDAELYIIIDPILYSMSGGGYYVPSERKIYLYKISLMTFLHEVAHAIMGLSEEKAVLWSHKVFYLAFPRLYMANVRKGRFFHIVPIEDLEKFNECLK
jgi:hypothetical protein